VSSLDETQPIVPGGSSSAPYDYEVPGAQSFTLQAVRASFDGSAAAESFLPCVQVLAAGGGIMASTVGSSVVAGGSADVTFAPFLDGGSVSSSCCDTSTQGYEAVALATSPRAFWKLNETSGTTAHDATGNGYDLTVSGVGSLGPGHWAWAQPVGPPGDVTVTTQGGGPSASNGSLPARNRNWAAGGWIRIDNTSALVPPLMLQGDPFGNHAGGGWVLTYGAIALTWSFYWSDGANIHSIDANGQTAGGVWALVGAQDDNGTFSLWINGVKQSTTAANTMVPAGGVTFAQHNGGGFYLRGGLSWSFVWDRPLTQAEWTALATPGGVVPSGWVLTSDGAGSASYAPLSSGTATAGYKLYADGAGGTYWAP